VLPPAARAYVALTAVLAVGAVALLVAVDDGPLVDRPLLVAAVAARAGETAVSRAATRRRAGLREHAGEGETFSFELPVEPRGASGALVRSVLAGHTVSERGHRRRLIGRPRCTRR
jgi:hypothetical protein